MSQATRTTTLEKLEDGVRQDKVRGRSRSPLRVPLALQLIGAVLVVSSVIVGVFSSHAGASSLSNGPVTIQITGGGTAQSPLANNQVVNVSVGPNSTLSRSSLEAAGFPSGVVGMKVLQCTDPGGSAANLPQNVDSCAPATIISGPGTQENGSVLIKGFTVYTVPDEAVLGTSNGTMCDTTHECVLGIFSNQENFGKPHLFSAPFMVTGGTATPSTSSSASSGPNASNTGASPGVSVPPAALANTGGPTLWPWLLGAGVILLLVGSGLRYFRRPTPEGRS